MAGATATTKRVGGASTQSKKGTTEGGGEKPKKGRTPYDYSKLVNADGSSVVNDKGLLTVLPPELKNADGTVRQAAFNPKTNKPLKRKEFGDDSVFYRYRALVL